MKKLLYYIIPILLFGNLNVQAQFAGGSGTEADPWQIKTLVQLDSVRNHLEDNFILMNDLDFDGSDYDSTNSEIGWVPIGSNTESFKGDFDGNDHSIKNLYINQTEESYLGIFATANYSTIKNLDITCKGIYGSYGAGSLAGYVYNCEILNCTASVNIHITGGYTGGLVAYGSSTTIKNCSVEGKIYGEDEVGGLAGYLESSNIEECAADVTVSGNTYVGGLFGYLQNSTTVKNCKVYGIVTGGDNYTGGLAGTIYKSYSYNSYADCYVSGYSYVGGLVGYLYSSKVIECVSLGSVVSDGIYGGGLIGECSYGTIEDSYTSTSVTGNKYVGGLSGIMVNSSLTSVYAIGKVSGKEYAAGYLGYLDYGTMSNAYFNSELTGQTEDIAVNYTSLSAVDLTTSQMMEQTSYSGFDFDDTWGINEGKSFACLSETVNLPVIINDFPEFIKINVAYKDTIHFFGMDNQDISISLEDAPSGMTLTNDSIISWTPTKGGVYEFKIIATDADGIYSVLYLPIKVIPYQGDGTEASPYEITSISDLDFVRYQLDKSYVLANDIDFDGSKFSSENSTVGWTVIGTTERPFTGNLDGQGYVIKNLFINTPDEGYIGLFGYSSDAVFENIGLVNCEITGSFEVGGLTGFTQNSSINNCYVTGAVMGSDNRSKAIVGLLAGMINDSEVSGCYTIGSSKGANKIGGLIGYAYSSEVENCFSNSFVVAGTNGGGLIGMNKSTVSDCYAAGVVTGGENTGSFIGINSSGTVSGCYYLVQSIGNIPGYTLEDGSASVNSLAASKMKQSSSFSGWDFTNTWEIDENLSFPKLKSTYNFPIIVKTVDPAIMLDSAYTVTLEFVPMDYDVSSLSSESVPDGMELSSDNEISWTPDATGYFDFGVKVTDKNSKDYTLKQNIFVSPSEGYGTENVPFIITSVDGLDAVRYNLGSSYELGNNINLSGSSFDASNSESGWEPIGSEYTDGFYGSLNGKNHYIKNLYCNQSNINRVGLFSKCSYASVDSLIVNNANISGNFYVGVITGYSQYSTINNCFASGVIKGVTALGGVTGSSYMSSFNNLYSTVDIISNGNNCGGLIGSESYSDITNCAATGDITSDGNNIGGLIGYKSHGSITNCYATGVVTGDQYIGGFVGFMTYSNSTNSYATGNVEASSYAGGFVGSASSCDSVAYCYSKGIVSGNYLCYSFIGYNSKTPIEQCYYDSTIAGSLQSVNVTSYGAPAGLTTSQMLNSDNFDNWDFLSTWAISIDKTYPALQSLNNAPFAFSDTAKGTVNDLMEYNYDYETSQDYLVYKVKSITSVSSGTDYTNNSNDIVNGDSLLITYRVGEYQSGLSDTLWGNQVTSLLEVENHAPVITSTAPTTAVQKEEYTYEVVATDEDGDQLYYSLQNAPAGMYIEGNTVYWTPGEDVTTSGEVTVIVSDGIYTDNETFTIEVEEQSNIRENEISDNTHFYPNPVKDILYITSDETINNIKIVSLTGEIVLSDNVDNVEKQLNLSSLNDGLYIVVLYYDKGIKTQRIIKN